MRLEIQWCTGENEPAPTLDRVAVSLVQVKRFAEQVFDISIPVLKLTPVWISCGDHMLAEKPGFALGVCDVVYICGFVCFI